MPASPAPIAKGPVRTASSSSADGESEQVRRLTVSCACQRHANLVRGQHSCELPSNLPMGPTCHCTYCQSARRGLPVRSLSQPGTEDCAVTLLHS